MSKMIETPNPNGYNNLTFTDVAGDTYDYPHDVLAQIGRTLEMVPTDSDGQADSAEVSLELYDNQIYIDGEPSLKKIKHIAFVVIYE